MTEWRDVYRRAVQPESYWTADELGALIEEIPWAEEDRQEPVFSGYAARSVLSATQPMASALGATLHTLIAPGGFEDEDRLRLLATYVQDVGLGAPRMSRFAVFQEVMTAAGLTEEATSRFRISKHTALQDSVFVAPSVIFSMSRRPDLFDHELIGIDLHLRRSGLLRPWEWCRKNGLAGNWERLNLNSAFDGGPSPLQLVTQVIEGGRLDTARVRWGISFAKMLLRQWQSGVWMTVTEALNPRLAMENLLQRRSREASVYHTKSKLQGRTIQDWFRRAKYSPGPFVDALASSSYVCAGKPEDSRLLTTLSEFGGPMFRIFSHEDYEIISRWISSLNQPNNETLVGTSAPSANAYNNRTTRIHLNTEYDGAAPPASLRAAYTRLQARSLNSQMQDFANQYVDFWLSLAEASLERHPFPLPDSLPAPGGLVPWLLDAHDKHAQAVDLKAVRTHPPSRDAIVSSTLQLSPLTLIDGAWLFGFTDISHADTRVGCALFQTFYDELGNGDIAINHPQLYRKVLEGMGIRLPPTASDEFASMPSLLDESFELPVYWLAIGRFPDSRRPEILGLNLAMELSGVGGGYLVARQGLKAHGFPTIFVDLHNTIDNVSTGHAAWAAKAIESFVDIARSSGASNRELDALWGRIRTGFASLDPDRGSRDFFGPREFRGKRTKPTDLVGPKRVIRSWIPQRLRR